MEISIIWKSNSLLRQPSVKKLVFARPLPLTNIINGRPLSYPMIYGMFCVLTIATVATLCVLNVATVAMHNRPFMQFTSMFQF